MNSNDLDPTDLFPAQTAQQPAFDFKAFLETARRLYWIILITLALGLLGGALYVRSTRPIYRAQAEIKAERRSATPGVSLTGETLAGDSAMTPEDLKTVERTFLSSALMKRVVQKLNLTERPDFLPGNRKATEGELVGTLMQNSKVSLVPETRLISISFEHSDPNTAKEVANALAEEGIAIDSERLAASIQANVEYLKGEAEKLNAKLTKSKKDLNDYSRTLNSASFDHDLNIVADKLRDLSLRATQAKSERFKIESDYHEIVKCEGDTEKLIRLDAIRGAAGIPALTGRINELKGNLAKLLRRYREGHPFVIQASTELKDLEGSLHQKIAEAALGVESSLAAARSNEQALVREQEEQEQKVLNLNDKAIHSQVLKGQIDVDQLAYEATLKRLNEELSQTRSQPVLLQLSTAAGPGYPITVPPKKAMLTALGLGLLAGIGFIALIVQLDSSIKTAEVAERVLALPVLAPIPQYLSRKAPGTRWADCAPLHDPQSNAAESFRTLRTALHTMMESDARKFILLTSTLPGEGATFCSLNLGVSLAQSGLRTLLIDGNLRDSAIEERIFGSQGHYGLSDFLVGKAPLSSIILSSGVPNLDVITAGSPSPHPVELLSRSRLRVLLDGVSPLYDRVVVDSAAVVGVSDTLCFARFFPTICLIIRSGKTSKTLARRAIDLLSRSGAKVSGIALNYTEEKAPKEFLINTAPFPSLGDGHEADFPKTCSSCGRHYTSMEDYLNLTHPLDAETTQEKANVEFQQSPDFARRCTCGAIVALPPVKRRDLSGEGLRRRELFSELLDALQNSGLPREEARAKLLLTLKIWRNEISSEIPGEESEAGKKRRQLFDELLGQLEKTGLTHETARTKLLETIDIWRLAP